MGTQVTGVASESDGAAATNGFWGWSSDADRSPYLLANGRDGTAATAYATLTAYAVGKSVTDAGSTYVVRTAVAGSNATAPATNASFVNVENHRGPAEIQTPATQRPQFYR